ncbi:MAG: MAPEG family protein [Burkholderiaceae bacterium]
MHAHLLLPALATLATLFLLFVMAAIVGRARVRYGIAAPATSGHENFDRAYRVQMNTLENVVLFLPALWLAATFFHAQVATVLAGVWLIGRVWYAAAYLKNPARRGPGFLLAFLAWGGLMLIASWGVLRALLSA